MKIFNSEKQLLLLSIGLCLASSLFAQLDPELKPGENFNLSEWKLNYPMNNDTQEDLSSFSNAYFYTDSTTGGIVFNCPNIVNGTGGSSYPRCELRELLNKGASASAKSNNWTLSTNPTREYYGGYNGVLEATLTVDHVSTTYDEEFRVGRVIVGQIHADDNEPCRLYYRLLPGNTKGSIYFAHEQSKVWGSNKKEFWHELIGSRSSSAEEPENGIALGELWGYKIDVQGESMTVTIYNSEGIELASKTIASYMTGDDNFDANYANADNYLYFKAGVYNQNNGGDAADYAQATFYQLSNVHSPDSILNPSDLVVTPSSLNFSGVGGTEIVNITTTDNWTCTTTDSWITLSTNNGSGNGTLEVSVDENIETEIRNGSINVIAEDGTILIVTVSQAINDGGVGVNNEALNKISIFPNPSKGHFTIENCVGSYLQILNISGAVVFKQQIANNYEYITTNLPKGVYITNVIGEHSLPYSSKLIIE